MIYEFLAQHGIPHQRFDHPAMFTCEDAKLLTVEIPGAETKNLFLRDGKGKRHFLVSVRPQTMVDLKEFGRVVSANGVGFASAERLKKYLGVEPGAVTLLGLINDNDRGVEVIIEQELWDAAAMQCHPLVNTATLVLAHTDMERFLTLSGHTPRVMTIPQRAAGNS